MNVKFCGAARCVTGSSYLISYEGGKILVDCGMRQGVDKKTELGEDRFPFEPQEITALLLTHAHIDHSGLIPLLVKRGFKGEIITTAATAALASIMLPDSGHIQEQDASYQTRKNLRAGKPPAEPLYTVGDAEAALKGFKSVEYDTILDVAPGVRARFVDVGHLLGSAAIEVWVTENHRTLKITFSGDIGRADRPIIRDPKQIKDTDYLVVEGTYGDRNHEVSSQAAKQEHFAKVLKAALVRGGNIVIPSFAVGRTQELLYFIKHMLLNNAVPGLERVPVYLDSPLGINATRIYESCAAGYYDSEALLASEGGSPFEFPTLRVALTSDESKRINTEPGSSVIISSSGMCDAGRIRHHLKHNLYRADSTVIFAGYQAEGTLGRLLVDGVKKVKLFGEDVRVNATIEQLEGFSGHAGRDELIEWIGAIENKPSCIFLVHGEGAVLDSFGQAVGSLGYHVTIPKLMEEFALAGRTEAKLSSGAPDIQRGRVEATYEERLKRAIEKLSETLADIKWEDSDASKLTANILEADIKALADKWEGLLKKQ